MSVHFALEEDPHKPKGTETKHSVSENWGRSSVHRDIICTIINILPLHMMDDFYIVIEPSITYTSDIGGIFQYFSLSTYRHIITPLVRPLLNGVNQPKIGQERYIVTYTEIIVANS